MEKLQIYSQCSSRTQHKPWGLGGDNNGLKVHSSTILPASPVLSTSFTLPVPLPAHANAHTPRRTKLSRKTVSGVLHRRTFFRIHISCEVGQIKVESVHTRTHLHAGKHKASLIDDAYQAKTNPLPPRAGKQAMFLCSSVTLRHFGAPLQRSRRRNLLSWSRRGFSSCVASFNSCGWF